MTRQSINLSTGQSISRTEHPEVIYFCCPGLVQRDTIARPTCAILSRHNCTVAYNRTVSRCPESRLTP